MSRILAIDFGKKRTGLAVTDPLQIIANGLTTVATSTLMDFLKEYTSREKSNVSLSDGRHKQMDNHQKTKKE